MAEPDRVSVPELADELGTYRSSVFKVIKRLGIQPLMQRDSSARHGQRVAMVTVAEATAIREELTSARRSEVQSPADAAVLAANEGMFYLIQLEPEHDPGRFKVGFTTDLDGRLRHHRCAAPFARYRKN